MIVRVGGCSAVVAQWQSTGGSSQSVLGSTPGGCWPFHIPVFSSHSIPCCMDIYYESFHAYWRWWRDTPLWDKPEKTLSKEFHSLCT